MAYTPKYNTNQLPEYNDFSFSLWKMLQDVLVYYNTTSNRAVHNGQVEFGFTDESIVELSTNDNIEWLLTVQLDNTNISNTINPSQVGIHEDPFYTFPYIFTLRVASDVGLLNQKVLSDPKFRVIKILQTLQQDVCNSNYTSTIVPNTIDYYGVTQTNLSNRAVTISNTANTVVGEPVVTEETLNSRSFVTANQVFQIFFRRSF